MPTHKGGHRNTAFNFRPISLTSQLCRAFEARVRDEVVYFFGEEFFKFFFRREPHRRRSQRWHVLSKNYRLQFYLPPTIETM